MSANTAAADRLPPNVRCGCPKAIAGPPPRADLPTGRDAEVDHQGHHEKQDRQNQDHFQRRKAAADQRMIVHERVPLGNALIAPNVD